MRSSIKKKNPPNSAIGQIELGFRDIRKTEEARPRHTAASKGPQSWPAKVQQE